METAPETDPEAELLLGFLIFPEVLSGERFNEKLLLAFPKTFQLAGPVLLATAVTQFRAEVQMDRPIDSLHNSEKSDLASR